ncbi:hypothetical protein C0584_03395 [Candidatus Parcubacteria bacterium]|nr:MAG: hypothetical protein C0584_03395 [Candidatus Parcubacteria bacterium]
MINNFFQNNKGSMLVTVMVASSIFIVIAVSLIELGLLRQKVLKKKVSQMQSIHIAEAGVNYYRWHLAHDEVDFMDGTGSDPGGGGEPYGPYIHTYTSPGGDVSGQFSLEITPPPTGSTIVTISSTGWSFDNPSITRTVEVKYGIKSMAHYAYLSNNDIWLGSSESIKGEIHSNGGIRMDGNNDSLVGSTRSDYICDTSMGCDFSNCAAPCSWASSECTCPGVWGDGPNFDLWDNPVPSIDFNVITVDIAIIKAAASSPNGYFPTTGGGSDGYHISFLADGTFDIYEVTSLKSSLSQVNDDWDGWESVAEEIDTQSFISNYSVPLNGIIYAADDLWIDGIVNDKITVVAAYLPDNVSKRKSIIINDNITCQTRDDSCILGLVAQKNIKVPRHAPTDLTIDSILLAQNGRVFRNQYATPLIKDSIEVYGGIVSNKAWTWSWVDGLGSTIDGYATTTSIYNNYSSFSPPPYFPNTGEYEFISWEEK